VFHYIGVHLERSPTTRDVDLAIRWGFGWNEGPFEGWQAAGWKQVAEWVQEDIAAGKALQRAAAGVGARRPGRREGRRAYGRGLVGAGAKRFVPRSDLPSTASSVPRAAARRGRRGPEDLRQDAVRNDAVRAHGSTTARARTTS
jgi:3-hydroxyacyl-CoA dehydrogenase